MLADYRPANVPDRDWEIIGPFVRAAVADCQPATWNATREFLWPVSRHVHWCWKSAGLPLDRESIFHPEVVTEFVVHECGGMSTRSAGNVKRLLQRMTELLVPHLTAPQLPGLTRFVPSAPYTDTEYASLVSWAAGQATAHRRLNAHVLLSLGLGAGLSAVEIGAVTTGDITVDDDGVLIDVRGERSRTVPVLARWEHPLEDLASAAIRPDIPVFRPQAGRTRNLITGFVATCNAKPGPNTQRMRATWIVGHLVAGVPVRALMAAAGVDTLHGLTRFVAHTPELTSKQVRAALQHTDDQHADTQDAP